jgi:two-component system, NarL family, sensor kinase
MRKFNHVRIVTRLQHHHIISETPQGDYMSKFIQSALDALSAHIAVLDREGTIVAVNRAWCRFGRANGLRLTRNGVGSNYIPFAASNGTDLRDRLLSVLSGRTAGFSLQYSCSSPKCERWFDLQVRGFGKARARRVLVAHEDITSLKQAERATRELAALVTRAREAERRHLARELHDSTAQELLLVSLNLSQLQVLLKQHARPAKRLIDETHGALERAQSQLRTLAFVLHSAAPDGHALGIALKTLIKGFSRRTGIRVHFASDQEGRLPEPIERAVFSVVQEALINIYRHSGSRSAKIALLATEQDLSLEITDSGRGNGTDGPTAGVGVDSMRARISEIGGSLTIISTSRGTSVRATVPHNKVVASG